MNVSCWLGFISFTVHIPVCNEIMAILARALLGWLMGAVGAVVVVAAYMFTSVVPQNLTP